MLESSNAWENFLISQGARSAAPTPAAELDFGPEKTSPGQGFISPLTHLGVLAAVGEDAANFLHNQLSNDVLGLDETSARLAGYCSPKGRLLTTMMVWKTEEAIYLAMPRSLLAAVQKRLQMFIMRSKLKLSDVSDSMILLGLALPKNQASVSFPLLPTTPYTAQASDAGKLIALPQAQTLSRYLWTGTLQQAMATWTKLAAELPPAPASLWRWSEVLAGTPQITPATQEQFVPQMINFEIIGGVNFRKGCYPGQEIVARSQYLGKFKRRMQLARIDASEVAPGMEVFASNDAQQPCGMIVNAEHGPDGKLVCLVEIKLDARNEAVHLGHAQGPLLHFIDLPYALPESV